MHRFVGYLEETACHTYLSIVQHVETPGTDLNTHWANLPAPDMAKGYWKLPNDATWVDTLKCMVRCMCVFTLITKLFLFLSCITVY